MLHLDIQPGTDIALFNGLFTYVVEQGWIDKDFIAAAHERASTPRSQANKLSLDECSRITGVPVAKLRQAAEWAYKPKAGGQRPRTMHAYEKGIIWGNDNYLIQSALVDLVLATHNVGRRGTGVVRMGGHQEGYTRPPYPGDNKIYIDQEIIQGKGLMIHVRGRATTSRPRSTPSSIARGDPPARQNRQGGDEQGARRHARADGRRHLRRRARTRAGCSSPPSTSTRRCSPRQRTCMLPAAHPGEMNLTSMNGERRLRLSREVHGPAGRGQAGLPDRRGHRQHAEARCTEAEGNADDGRSASPASTGRPRRTPSTTASAAPASRASPPIDSQGGGTGNLATYERLRAAGNNGVQLPIKEYKDGKLIGTEMLYTDGKFDTADGKAQFKPSPWPGLPQAWSPTRRPSTSSGSTTAASTRSGRRATTTSTTSSCATAGRWPSSK